jgi:predicted HD phosphohydrolase
MIRKLTIKFKDGSKVTYTIRKNYVDPMQYFDRHSMSSMESATLQIYPKKDNEPIDFLKLVKLNKEATKDPNQSSPR